MDYPELVLYGKVLTPLFTSQQALSRAFVPGEDERGPFVACRLHNRNPSKFYGWYVLVSPEDLPLMKWYGWFGTAPSDGNGGIRSVEVRRRKGIGGIQKSFLLSREIWSRMHAGDMPKHVYRLGHPLDFRRMNLSQFVLGGDSRGITYARGAWQVQLTLNDKSHYLGRALYPDDGYRMYNRHLKMLKEQCPNDSRIQAMPYNKTEPLF